MDKKKLFPFIISKTTKNNHQNHLKWKTKQQQKKTK